MLSDFLRFIVEMFQHYVSAWGGVVLMLIAIWEAARDKKVPKRFFFGSAIAFLLVATFLAWRDEYTSANWRGNRITDLTGQLDQTTATKSPDIVAEMEAIATGEFHKQPLIVVGMQLSNRNGAPSGVNKFRMRVELDDSRNIEGIVPLSLDQDLKMPLYHGTKIDIDLKSKAFLPSEGEQAICSGCAIEGWFWSVYPSVARLDDLYAHNAVVVVEFNDIATGQLHVIKKPIGAKGFHFPGNENQNP